MNYVMEDPATGVAEGILKLHHELMVVMIGVVGFVFWIGGRSIYKYEEGKVKEAEKRVHGEKIEIIWTIIPGIILGIIGIPSFALLYAMEEVVEAGVTLKVVGHQWYWSYEYGDQGEEGIEFESYMIEEEELREGELRLLECDNRVVLPIERQIRLIVTSGDVLHSFAVPGFGIKIDGCPGRLNQVSLMIKREGVYYGQCSELCGVNHAFMPIAIEGVKEEEFINWIK